MEPISLILLILALVFSIIFLIDLVIPDPIFLLDELLLFIISIGLWIAFIGTAIHSIISNTWSIIISILVLIVIILFLFGIKRLKRSKNVGSFIKMRHLRAKQN